jgi:hypothetical protein
LAYFVLQIRNTGLPLSKAVCMKVWNPSRPGSVGGWRSTTSKIDVGSADGLQTGFKNTVRNQGGFLKHGEKERVSRGSVGKQNDDPDARLNT